MKLIIKQYLASLKERDELDAILPDLLSQLGLTVFSRPGRGTRQNGVDVAAVGCLDSSSEKVYLLSIKSGDLTRSSWSTESPQSLRPSLDEIIDTYIPNRLPQEHKEKHIVICLCFGGDIQEQVRESVEGYIKKYQTEKLTFEEWNGDKLASLILSSFLSEDLFSQDIRSQLRKALALLDEPNASYQHFYSIINAFSNQKFKKNKDRITALRQINICLWIIFSWARDAGNLEAAYLSAEVSLLHAWYIANGFFSKKSTTAQSAQATFHSILSLYLQICSEFIDTKITPHVSKKHALSSAVQATSSLDVNLKLFDILGRLAMEGIWAYRLMTSFADENAELTNELKEKISSNFLSIKQLIVNNPVLFLPIKDSQSIDISLAALMMAIDAENHSDLCNWFSEIVDRSTIAHQVHYKYPCNLQEYGVLLEHSRQRDDNYRREVTGGSVLFPLIALWAGLLNDGELYRDVQNLKREHLSHCNFQFWYPDEVSEEYFYTNKNAHGAALSHVRIDNSMDEFLAQIFSECENSDQFYDLSAVKHGLWPLILVACRHYRLPTPLHLLKGFYPIKENTSF